MKHIEEIKRACDITNEGYNVFGNIRTTWDKNCKIVNRINHLIFNIKNLTKYLSPNALINFEIDMLKEKSEYDKNTGHVQLLTCNSSGLGYVNRYSEKEKHWNSSFSQTYGVKEIIKILSNPEITNIIKEKLKTTRMPKQVFDIILNLKPEINELSNIEDERNIELKINCGFTYVKKLNAGVYENSNLNIIRIEYDGNDIKLWHVINNHLDKEDIRTYEMGDIFMLSQISEEINESIKKFMIELNEKELQVEDLNQRIESKIAILKMAEKLKGDKE